MKPLTAGDPASLGPFRLLGVLGSGGMGRVYLGESLAGRRVAIKVIRADLAEDPVFRHRFEREIAAARTVSPLYTAPVVDADADAPAPWFATAYIDGPSLSALVHNEGPLAPGAVLTLAAGLAEALASIHGAGLVHRDLSPSNIILDDGGPHIIDFGIALGTNATKLTAGHLMLGTPAYIAPEVIDGADAGPPSDVFVLGATLAFAASGKHLVSDGTVQAQIMQITRGRFNLDGVPPQIRPLIVRCTAMNPAHRPTASEVVHILVGAGVARPSRGWFTSREAVVPAIKVPPAAGVSRRRVLLGATAAGLVAATTGAAAWAGVFTPDRRSDAGPEAQDSPSPARSSGSPAPEPTGPGSIVWRAHSGATAVGLSAAGLVSPTRIIVDRGERLIATNSAGVFAITLDGEPVWSQTLAGGSINLWPWGDAILVTDSRRLWLLDAANGTIRFLINAADDETSDSLGDNREGLPIQLTGVVLSASTAFVGLNTATVAFDRDGGRLWRRSRPNPRNGIRPPEGAPIATLGRYLLLHDAAPPYASIALRNAEDGALQWLVQYPAPKPGQAPAGPGGPGGPAGSDGAWNRSEGRLTDTYAVIRNGQQVRVVALKDGHTVWSGDSPTPVAGMELDKGMVLVAADQLRAFDLITKAQRWEYNVRGARVAVVGDGNIFVANDESMSLVDVHGQPLWSQPYPPYLVNAVPDWVGVAGDEGYVTFQPQDQPGVALDFDVIAVNLGTA
jgi:predicted Ser/Thr protein kinase